MTTSPDDFDPIAFLRSSGQNNHSPIQREGEDDYCQRLGHALLKVHAESRELPPRITTLARKAAHGTKLTREERNTLIAYDREHIQTPEKAPLSALVEKQLDVGTEDVELLMVLNLLAAKIREGYALVDVSRFADQGSTIRMQPKSLCVLEGTLDPRLVLLNDSRHNLYFDGEGRCRSNLDNLQITWDVLLDNDHYRVTAYRDLF